MNWAPYAVYNPQLWHWPEDWPLVSLSPTVEPFIVIGYVDLLLRPVLPGGLDSAPAAGASAAAESFVWRHPLISLAAAALASSGSSSTRSWRSSSSAPGCTSTRR